MNKDKSILMYRHLFITQMCSATCFGLHEIIIRRTYKNPVLVFELYFNIDPYCNGYEQRVARQQLCKHGPTRNNRGNSVFCARGDVTQQWIETI
jgi:hypothetical protein